MLSAGPAVAVSAATPWSLAAGKEEGASPRRAPLTGGRWAREEEAAAGSRADEVPDGAVSLEDDAAVEEEDAGGSSARGVVGAARLAAEVLDGAAAFAEGDTALEACAEGAMAAGAADGRDDGVADGAAAATERE